MSSQASTKQSVELNMIGDDTLFYSCLAQEVLSGNSSGVVILGLIPYLSLYTIETFGYFKSWMPVYAKQLERRHETILRASRTQTKLFDDRRKDIIQFVDFMDEVSDLHTTWFRARHSGQFSWLRKLLQPDLGLYFYENRLICSTHIAFINVGYAPGNLSMSHTQLEKSLPVLSRSVGYDIGEYLGHLASILNLNISREAAKICRYDLYDDRIRSKDTWATKFYATTFNGPATPRINACLTWFQATTNFLTMVFKHLVIDTNETFFKAKFITLFHLVSSLRKLQNYYYPKNVLSAESKYYLQQIFSDKSLKLISSAAGFRNILVHYTIEDVPDNNLNPNVALYGLVEYFFDGRSFEDLDSQVDHQIERLSNILDAWSKGS